MEPLMETLIAAVRVQPSLWNPLHNEYREPAKKEDAWMTVIQKINDKSIPNIKIAKAEWKRLRDNHRDALKRAKLGKNKLLPSHITTWKYAKAMQFLEPYMKYRITENIEAEPKKNLSSDQVSTTEENQSKRPKIDTPSTSQTRSEQPQESEVLGAFFNLIHKSTREMPQWMQMNVKKKIFAVIIDAEEELAKYKEQRRSEHVSEELITDDIDILVKQEYVDDEDDEFID